MNIKRSNQHLALSLLITFVSIVTISAQTWPPRYALTRYDEAWLTYAYVVNQFDSAATGIFYGEFAVVRNGVLTNRPIFVPSEGYSVSYPGSDEQGPDDELASQLRTSTFRYQTGDSLRFHRMMVAHISCAMTGPPTPPTSNDASRIDADGRLKYFDVARLDVVADTTEWILTLVDAHTDERLVDLDTVGMLPNTGSVLVTPYGTQPLVANRKVPLPDAFAGRDVHLQVIPARYGPTPFGLGLSFLANNYSLSANMEYLPSGYVPDDTDEGRILLEKGYVAALVQHYDSILAADGCVVDMETSIVLPNDSTWRWFLGRYFTNVVVDSNGIRYDRRPCPMLRASGAGAAGTRRDPMSPSIRVERSREPLEIRLRIDVKTPLPGLAVSLYEVGSGKLVSRVDPCPASRSDCFVRFTCPQAGPYLVVLSDPRGWIESTKLMVQ